MEKISVAFLRKKKNNIMKTGLDKYADELLHALNNVLEIEYKVHYLGIGFKARLKRFLNQTNFLKDEPDVDLIHLLSPFLTISKIEKPLVVTIHDCCPLIVPEAYPPAIPKQFFNRINNYIELGAYFIVNSQNTRKDLQKFFKIPDNRIFVTLLGVNENLKPINNHETLNQAKKKYHLPDHYFLYLGSMNKRKNLETTIDSFQKLTNNYANDLKLVIAGRMDWGGKELVDYTIKKKMTSTVLFPGYIDFADINAVISQAKATLYLSRYEGFGLPVLESMACGTAVICSNNSSIPEVAGDSALLVDPEDKEEISMKMEKILSNQDLKRELIEKGLARAKKFQWRSTASQTLLAYQKVLK